MLFTSVNGKSAYASHFLCLVNEMEYFIGGAVDFGSRSNGDAGLL